MAAQIASKKALDYVDYVPALSSMLVLCLTRIAGKLAMECFGRLSINLSCWAWGNVSNIFFTRKAGAFPQEYTHTLAVNLQKLNIFIGLGKNTKLIRNYNCFCLESSYLLSDSFSCCIRGKNMHVAPFFKYETSPVTTKDYENISIIAN